MAVRDVGFSLGMACSRQAIEDSFEGGGRLLESGLEVCIYIYIGFMLLLCDFFASLSFNCSGEVSFPFSRFFIVTSI